MKDVVLDGAAWSTKDDVYDAFFLAVGPPDALTIFSTA